MEDENIQISSDDIIIDVSNYGAAQPTYAFSGGADSIDISGISTITLPSSYSTYTGMGSTVGYNGTSSTISWSNSYNVDPAVNITSDGINIKEGGDIKLGGKSLSEAIEKIEERFGILKPNPELEDRWEQLKERRKQYIELEKDLLEKEKIMKILKET